MTARKNNSISYADSGVSIEQGNALVERIKPAVKATERSGVAGELGGFGGLFDLKACGFSDPVLVSATDGVGTKLRLAIDSGQYGGVGIDLVAMCVNDIIVQGAEPLFFLDYFASGSLDIDVASAVIESIAKGCEIAGAALIGGETAEMPDMYASKDFDLAGFCVGAANRQQLIDGTTIVPGDCVIGLASSGIHSNGFSLVRKILAQTTNFPEALAPLESTLLTPTRIYVKSVLSLLQSYSVKGIAHITGGGFTENIPRVLPHGTGVNINLDAWDLPLVFQWLMDEGPIEESEMLRTFNCGIGLVLVVEPTNSEAIIRTLESSGETVYGIGEVVALGDQNRVTYVGNFR
ncbi:MAG: phosphoribosylformylglycinamidine cyclo-ligase [Gammaproteobacteria bacterium]